MAYQILDVLLTSPLHKTGHLEQHMYDDEMKVEF